MNRRRRLACIATATVLFCPFSRPAIAQAYPSKPVRVIIPFSPGGSNDTIARIIARKLSVAMGQPFVAENRPGAGGMIGANAVAKSPADGYTLLMMDLPFSIIPSIYADVPYDATRDFIPVTLISSAPLLLFTHPSVPARNLDELIALAKTQPGKLNYASAGLGSTPHLAAEYFKMLAGVNLTHVPYKGGGPAITDLVAGRLSLMITNLPQAIPYVKDGRVRAIAVTGARRAPLLPDTPTFEELGMRSYRMTGWNGMFVPAGTPRDVVARLHNEVVKVLALPDVKEQLKSLGAEVGGDTPEQFAAVVQAEIDKWRSVVRASGMRAE